MKLVFCPRCQDVFKFGRHEFRRCECGASGGKYAMGGHNGVLFGDGIPLGIDNQNFIEALEERPEEGKGRRFDAFVIPRECKTLRHMDRCPHGLPEVVQPQNIVPFRRS